MTEIQNQTPRMSRKLLGKIVDTPAPSTQMVGGDIRRQILEFIQMSYDLSTWAACINWRSKENQKEW
ncbi:hypothetical protein DEM27_00005, partial [Metarhizobium album]